MAKAIQIQGEIALMKRLNSMAGSAQRVIARLAVREAAGEVRKAARRNAPSVSGQLKKSIKNVARTYKGAVIQVIGPARGFKIIYKGKPRDPANYAHLVEFGTKPHLISPKGGKGATKTLKIGQTFVVGSVSHPGTPAKPFLRPAFDGVPSFRIITNRMKKEIYKQAAKKSA